MRFYLLVLLIYTAYTDIRQHKIHWLPCMLIALVFITAPNPMRLCGVVMVIPFLCACVLPKQQKFGGGDVKLVAALGVAVGAGHMFWITVISLVSFCTYAVCRGEKNALPLAPFVLLAYLLTLCCRL